MAKRTASSSLVSSADNFLTAETHRTWAGTIDTAPPEQSHPRYFDTYFPRLTFTPTPINLEIFPAFHLQLSVPHHPLHTNFLYHSSYTLPFSGCPIKRLTHVEQSHSFVGEVGCCKPSSTRRTYSCRAHNLNAQTKGSEARLKSCSSA